VNTLGIGQKGDWSIKLKKIVREVEEAVFDSSGVGLGF
jgi:hypothetical protein